MKPTPGLSGIAAFCVAILVYAGAPSPAARAAADPGPFTGQLTEVEGVQAILSLKHPKLLNRDLEKFMAGVPEAAMLRMALSSSAAYGYPQFSEIAAGSNIGVAVLSISSADLKANPPVIVGFAKLREGGKLWTLLTEKGLTLQKHGDWVLVAANEANLSKLASPDAVIAYLEKPQAEDIRLWGRTSPEFQAAIKAAVIPPLQAKLADLPPEKRKAAFAYVEALYSLLGELHSVEVSWTFNDNASRISYSAQFLPASPMGAFLSSPPGPAPLIAQSISADALGTFTSRNNPQAFGNLTASIFDTLIAVDYPPMAARLKQWKATYLAFLAAIDGGGAGIFDLGLEQKDGRPQIRPRYFFVMSGHVGSQLARDYFRQAQTMNRPLTKMLQAKFKSANGGTFENHSTFAENAATVDGIPFDSVTVTNTLEGKEVSSAIQYSGEVDGNIVMADGVATLTRRLPALRAKKALTDGIPIPENSDEFWRATLNGGRIVDFVAEAAKLDRNDADVAAQVKDLKDEYAAAEPATLVSTLGQARVTVTLSIPYKFITASTHLGMYLSAQKINLLKLFLPPGALAPSPTALDPNNPVAFGALASSPVTLQGKCFVIVDDQPVNLSGITVRVCGADRYDQWDSWIFSQIRPRLTELYNQSQLATRQGHAAESKECLRQAFAMMEQRWNALPACPHAETDAKGNFTLTHHLLGPYYIFADAACKSGDKVEHLHWRISSQTLDAYGIVMLSNANATKNFLNQ